MIVCRYLLSFLEEEFEVFGCFEDFLLFGGQELLLLVEELPGFAGVGVGCGGSDRGSDRSGSGRNCERGRLGVVLMGRRYERDAVEIKGVGVGITAQLVDCDATGVVVVYSIVIDMVINMVILIVVNIVLTTIIIVSLGSWGNTNTTTSTTLILATTTPLILLILLILYLSIIPTTAAQSTPTTTTSTNIRDYINVVKTIGGLLAVLAVLAILLLLLLLFLHRFTTVLVVLTLIVSGDRFMP